eukprot:TRINITY_DN13310_c0_g2_i1.p1 TRINITY_DN13310_c0_g2~~TRINITY_DN13310_c0_g2_i1.p1  ORF type:complete len:260 (+),score=67.32 TRINITY_DN13310_c0_g2_i1:136-915(+)
MCDAKASEAVRDLPRAVGLVVDLAGTAVVSLAPFAFMLPWQTWAPCLYGAMAVFMANDWLTNNRWELNDRVMRKNGYKEGEMWQGVWTSFFTWPLTQVLGVLWLCPQFDTVAEVRDHVAGWDWGPALAVKVLGCLAVMELVFTISHRWMHQHRPGMHVMHHCVMYPSWPIGALTFDQVDLAVEFTGLVTIPIAAGYLLECPATMVVAFAATNAFAAMDHSQYVRLAHYYHHTFMEGSYHFFLQSRAYDEKNRIRSVVKL